ncbi:hypothetical protein CC86DRAFT_7582 [Ophiobolus disseminans]|uniref:Uncharacterized protein n=1 Tax=Ophiobolus disseminans TaxID=1469910 RepID=A0A6A7AJG8_9PLEO|nr:hypothetical protein CC86DRAFT_7582 [Ophiobolus disseminans]
MRGLARFTRRPSIGPAYGIYQPSVFPKRLSSSSSTSTLTRELDQSYMTLNWQLNLVTVSAFGCGWITGHLVGNFIDGTSKRNEGQQQADDVDQYSFIERQRRTLEAYEEMSELQSSLIKNLDAMVKIQAQQLKEKDGLNEEQNKLIVSQRELIKCLRDQLNIDIGEDAIHNDEGGSSF